LVEKGTEIDNPNFKDTVLLKDHGRHQAYMNCWITATVKIGEWAEGKVDKLSEKLLSFTL
jgi:hypothetical protein